MGELLVKQGYRIIHFCSEKELKRIQQGREERVLLKEAKKRGIGFIVNKTKDEYYKNLAQAETLIITSLADTLSLGTLEAAALNTRVIAPNWGPFPEYLPPDNLYPPYNLDKIIEMVVKTGGVFIQ